MRPSNSPAGGAAAGKGAGAGKAGAGGKAGSGGKGAPAPAPAPAAGKAGAGGKGAPGPAPAPAKGGKSNPVGANPAGANPAGANPAAAPGLVRASSGAANWNSIHCIRDWDRGNLYALRPGDVVVQGEKYCGIGVLLKECPKNARKTRIAYIQLGSPAHFSGSLAVEDTILDIDGIPCCTLQQATERIMGEAGTLVSLRVARCSDGEPQTVTLVRQVAAPSELSHKTNVVGLGVVVASSTRDPHPRVVEIMQGSSARLPAIQGVHCALHDRVSVVNGKDVRRIDVAKTARMIKGPPFTRVDMQIERAGVPIKLFLIRAELLSEEWMARALAYEEQLTKLQALEAARKPVPVPTVHQVLTAMRDEKVPRKDDKAPSGVASTAGGVAITAA